MQIFLGVFLFMGVVFAAIDGAFKGDGRSIGFLLCCLGVVASYEAIKYLPNNRNPLVVLIKIVAGLGLFILPFVGFFYMMLMAAE